MGDIAEMMLDGDICQYCGDFIGPGDGYPQSCNGCRDEVESDDYVFDCSKCTKTFETAQAAKQHFNAKHK